MSEVVGLSRRGFICTAVAVATLPALRTLPASAAPAVRAPTCLAWFVGTADGDMDWRFIKAATEAEAKAAWASRYVVACECEPSPDAPSDALCEFCEHMRRAEVSRAPEFDALREVEFTSADWMRAGFATWCSRCGYGCAREEDGHPVGSHAVCFDCMTLPDWDAVDPERAAELRADEEGLAPSPAPPRNLEALQPGGVEP